MNAAPPPSATEIVRSIARRETSVLEHVDAALSRIERWEPGLGAVTFVAAEEARERARELDRRLAAGEAVGPLAGVPTLVKDLYGFVPGWPVTLGGIPALAGERTLPGVWSAYPQLSLRGGAVLLGMTNSPAFGFRGITDNELFGPARNPFDLRRNAGGSSGGAAAAVAAGIVPVAGGSDAGGSIRIPAAWTNTVGFRPSPGRIPSLPRPYGFHLAPYIYEGPIARTVADAALFADALAEYDPRDPHAISGAVSVRESLRRGVRGLRIGYSADFGGFPVDTRVRATVERAVRAFEKAGAIVEPVDLRLGYDHAELTEALLRMLAVTTLADVDA